MGEVLKMKYKLIYLGLFFWFIFPIIAYYIFKIDVKYIEPFPILGSLFIIMYFLNNSKQEVVVKNENNPDNR